MAEQKKLSQIHMDIALQLAPRLAEPGVSTELVATYLATPSVLVKAKKDPAVMEGLIEQAAELPAEEAAELIADFFEQFTSWNKRSLGSLVLPAPETMAKVVLARPDPAPATDS